jgi:hypothetical protein
VNPTRRRRFLIIFLASLAIAGVACAETVTGNGVMRTQDRPVTGFSGIALGIPAKVEVKLGTTESMTIEADENLLPLIETTVTRGSLQIKPSRSNLELQSRAIRIVVQAKQVERLAIGGSGSIHADATQGKDLTLDVGGSGQIDVKRAQAEHVSIAIGGSGDVNVAGTARRVNVSIGGSGNARAGMLLADEVDVSIAGAGNALVAARSSLNATIAGSGDVRYHGDAVVRRTIVGSGSIKRVGPLPQ